MARHIIKINDLYLEWSTVVDTPVGVPMSFEQMETALKRIYGDEGSEEKRTDWLVSSKPARANRIQPWPMWSPVTVPVRTRAS